MSVVSIVTVCIPIIAALLLGVRGTTLLFLFIAAFIPFVVTMEISSNRIVAFSNAHNMLYIIIKEEWRTGGRIIPDWFEVPKGYDRLRQFPNLTASQSGRLRIAGKIKLGGLVMIMVMFAILGFSFPLLLYHVFAWSVDSVPFMVVVTLVAESPVIAFLIWVLSGFVLQTELKEYEMATGGKIPPP